MRIAVLKELAPGETRVAMIRTTKTVTIAVMIDPTFSRLRKPE